MKKKQYFVLMFFLVVLLGTIFSINKSFALNAQEYDEDYDRYTEEFKQYLKLPDEEKATLEVIPRKYEVTDEMYYKKKNGSTILQKVVSLAKNTVQASEIIPSSYIITERDTNGNGIIGDSGDINVDTYGGIKLLVGSQTPYGLCWDFSTIKCIETYLSLHGQYNEYEEPYDFSELHVDYLTSNIFGGWRELHAGGFFEDVIEYIRNMKGPVWETEVPYTASYSSQSDYEYLSSLMPKIANIEASDYPNPHSNENSINISDFRNDIKRHIMNNGSVYATIRSADIKEYNNRNVLCSKTGKLDHAISIIGWDDNFSKYNFPNESRPNNNGAYIALNSWGSEWGNNGIFYISYEDCLVEKEMSGITNAKLLNWDLGRPEITNIKIEDAKYGTKKLTVETNTNPMKTSYSFNGGETWEDGINSKVFCKSEDLKILVRDMESWLYSETKEVTITIDDNLIDLSKKQDCSIIGKVEGDKLSLKGTGETIGFDEFNDAYYFWRNEGLSYLNGIKVIEIGEGITTLGDYLFSESKVQTVILPKGLKNIGMGAFFESGVKDITLPQNISTIGKDAFYGCSKLNTLALPKKISSIGKNAFQNGINKVYYSSDSNALINNYKSKISGYGTTPEFVIDDLGPTITNLIKNGGKITIEAIDKAGTVSNPIEEGSGIFAYSFDGGNTWQESNIYSGGTSVEKIMVMDKVGNVSEYGNKLKEIKITTAPNKTEYIEGQNFVKTGMVVYAMYENFTEKEITNYTIINGTNLEYGQTSVTISYTEGGMEKTAKQPITVSYKKIEELSITKAPNKIKYVEGQLFNLAGLKLSVSYNNGKTETVNYPDSRISIKDGDKPLTTDVEKVIIVYTANETSSKEVEQKITVEVKKLSEIAIENPPNKITYKEGEDFDPTGMKIKLLYNDGDSRIIEEVTKDALNSGSNPRIWYGKKLTCDTQSVLIGYNDGGWKYKRQYITVEPIELIKIEVTTNPNVIDYIEGQNFDKTGMVVTATYEDGSTKEITDYEILNGTNLQYGQTGVKIRYEQPKTGITKETTFSPITVRRKTLTGITINNPPDRVGYLKGEYFDPTGMVVKAKYDNGKSAVITNYTYSPNDRALEITDTEVTISYTENGITKNKTQAIYVLEKIVESIEVTTPPTKTSYIEGEKFSKNGMVVTATNSDGTTNPVTNYTYTPTGKLSYSNNKITISYTEGWKTVKCILEIEVKEKSVTNIEITKEQNKKTFIEDEDFNLEGMEIFATYDNGTSATLKNLSANSRITVEYENGTELKYGDKYVTIKYTKGEGIAQARQNVIVEEKQITSVIIEKNPTKMTYLKGDNFDPTGMKIKVTYNNGKSDIIEYESGNGITCSPTTLNEVGQQRITVKYNGHETGIIVVVNEKELDEKFKGYVVDGTYLKGIYPNTTIGELKSKIEANGTIEVYNAAGNKITNEKKVIGTGSTIKIFNSEESKEYIAVVNGDCNGDGEANFTDILKINKHRLGKSLLTGAYLKAGDVDADGNVDFKDILKINKYRLKGGTLIIIFK